MIKTQQGLKKGKQPDSDYGQIFGITKDPIFLPLKKIQVQNTFYGKHNYWSTNRYNSKTYTIICSWHVKILLGSPFLLLFIILSQDCKFWPHQSIIMNFNHNLFAFIRRNHWKLLFCEFFSSYFDNLVFLGCARNWPPIPKLGKVIFLKEDFWSG